MIYTSYFASKAPKDRKLCIAKKRPRYFAGYQIKKLAPTNPWAKDWKGSYLHDLKDRFPGGQGLKELFEEIQTQAKDPVLCCYEKEPADCHRSLLAEYVYETIGINITEWQPDES